MNEVSFNRAISDSFAAIVGFFEAGEREPGASMFTEQIRTQVAELLGAKWTQIEPAGQEWLARWPELWPPMQSAWPNLSDSEREMVRNWTHPALEFYRRSQRPPDQSAGTSNYLANQRSVEMMEAATFQQQMNFLEAQRQNR
ncbi:MAG TPA: hypothetical protein VID51_01650 [Solirubrobacterales bacterium]